MATVKRMTKAAIVNELAERTELTKRDVTAVFDEMNKMIKRELGEHGCGEFVLPDLLKLKLKVTPAQANKKFRNPGAKAGDPNEWIIKDVEESRKVRATPLKKLKDLVLE